MALGVVTQVPWRWGATARGGGTAPILGNRRGDARCASCAGMVRRAETAFRPPPHASTRPSASPRRIGKAAPQRRKTGKATREGEGATAPTTETGEVWNRHSAIDAETPSIPASKLAYGRGPLRQPFGFPDLVGHGSPLRGTRKSHGKWIEGSLSVHPSSILVTSQYFHSRRRRFPNLPGDGHRPCDEDDAT